VESTGGSCLDSNVGLSVDSNVGLSGYDISSDLSPSLFLLVNSVKAANRGLTIFSLRVCEKLKTRSTFFFG